MRKSRKSFSLPFVLLALFLLLIFDVHSSPAGEKWGKADWDDPFDLPEKIPGDYEGKWYGIYCTTVPRDQMVGVRHGEAWPNQKIINSWGYKANPLEEIKDLLPESYYGVCSDPQSWGDVRINETAYIPIEQFPGDHQKLRREVTEKNKGTARLNEKGILMNWTNGMPFPGTEKGIELGWDFVNGRNYGEDLLARFFTSVVDRKGQRRYSVAEQCYLWWKGRLHGKHVPQYEPNPNNYDFYSNIGFYSPYDLRGLVMITHRYDSLKPDDMWMYIPVLRRVRRMSTTQRWDKFPGGSDLCYDAVTGFQGKVTNYDWKYLGRKELLCPRQAKDQIQEIKGKPIGACDQLYQRVNIILLEYVPRINSVISKAVMYLDPESYLCYYVDFYDKRGRPYLFMMYPWVIHASGYGSPIGFVVLDLQRTHSSLINTYDEYQDEDATAYGIDPSFFQMEFLRKRYSGR